MKNLDKKHGLKSVGLVFLLALGMICISGYSAEAQDITEIGSYIQANGISPSDRFMDLRYGSGGIIEFQDGSVILPKSPSPSNAILKSSDLAHLPIEPGKYPTVEFIQINMEAGRTFSLSYDNLVSFPGLKYLLVVSPDGLTEAQYSQMFSGFADSGVVILYQISRPG